MISCNNPQSTLCSRTARTRRDVLYIVVAQREQFWVGVVVAAVENTVVGCLKQALLLVSFPFAFAGKCHITSAPMNTADWHVNEVASRQATTHACRLGTVCATSSSPAKFTAGKRSSIAPSSHVSAVLSTKRVVESVYSRFGKYLARTLSRCTLCRSSPLEVACRENLPARRRSHRTCRRDCSWSQHMTRCYR